MMLNAERPKKRPMDSMIMAAVPIAVIYWILDSILNIFFYNKYNVLAELFGPDLYEIYTRLVVLSLLLFFGSHAQASINQLKTARDSLRQSEASHRAFIENLNVGIFRSTLDPSGRFIRANPAMIETLGYSTLEDLMQTPVSDHYVNAAEWGEFVADLTEKGLVKGREFKLKHRGGQPFWASFSAATKSDARGTARFMDAVVEDISQRKKAESALRTSEEKYRQLVNYAPAGIYEVDLNTGDFLRVNDVLCELTGYSREELLKMKCYDILSEGGKQLFFDRLITLHKGEALAESEEFAVRKKNGDVMWTAINARYHYEFDKPKSATVVLHDISRIKDAEQEKRRLEQQLYRAQKMEAIGTLAGGVAHDFNNLLMGMQGHISLMMSSTDYLQPYFHHLQTVENHIKSAADLTSKLLSFAKSGNFDRRTTRLNELAREQIQLFGRTRKDISIHEHYEAHCWMVEVDPVQIKQVLLNMIVNALQAMPEGGDLHIGTRNIVIENQSAEAIGIEPGRYVRLDIGDSGVGMDPETLRRVFEPFFTTRKFGPQKGTGLGLASAYGIIKNHGGAVRVASEPGKGTRFNIFLPVSKAPNADDVQASEMLRPTPEKILVVDRDRQVLDILKDMLARLGYEVIGTTRVARALEVLQRSHSHIDMVILDADMTDGNGKPLFTTLQTEYPRIKRLLTAENVDGEKARDIEKINLDVEWVMPKPFSLMTLSSHLSRVSSG